MTLQGDWLTLVLLILAGNELVEVLHHGSLFASWRGKLEIRDGFWGALVRCPFCMSKHTQAFLTVLAVYACLQVEVPSPTNTWSYVFSFSVGAGQFLASGFIWWLAGCRGINLLNDLAYACTRTPERRGGPTGYLRQEDKS